MAINITYDKRAGLVPVRSLNYEDWFILPTGEIGYMACAFKCLAHRDCVVFSNMHEGPSITRLPSTMMVTKLTKGVDVNLIVKGA